MWPRRLAAVAALLCGSVAAEPAIDLEIRNCIAGADSAAALAVCEQQGLAAWKKRVEQLHQALLTRLPVALRTPYGAAHEAWEEHRQREFGWIDLSFAQRSDGLAAPLAAGAKTELLRQRAALLTGYLANLPPAKPD